MMDVLSSVWPVLGCAHSLLEFVDYWFTNDASLDFDVLAQVDKWREAGGKAYLATVQEHERARYLWDTLGPNRSFDGMHYSAAPRAAKPDAVF